MASWEILYIYRARLRARLVLVQELLAVLGIAVGVALLFASQVASTSLDGSIQQLASGIVGRASLQMVARDPHGFQERLLDRVRRLPGVLGAAPVLEVRATLIGPRGRSAVDLIASDPHDVHLGGSLLRRFTAVQLASLRVLALPAPVAAEIGVDSLQTVGLEVGASRLTALMGAKLDAGNIGALVHSPVAIAPLAYAQEVSGLRGRVTRILVNTAPGREREVLRGLRELAVGQPVNVEPADFDAQLFDTAAAPADQSEELFSAISALVGFMFAFNAMLVTAHLRRNLVETLRRRGATRTMTLQVLLFDALVLGVLGTLLGLALGEALSIVVFRADPGYLAFAFAVGEQRIVTWQSVALAAGAGLAAACIGVLAPLHDVLVRRLRSSRELTGGPRRPRSLRELAGGSRRLRSSSELAGDRRRRDADGQEPSPAALHPRSWLRGRLGARPAGELGSRALRLLLGAGCLALTTTILLARPQSAILGSVTLVAALLLLLPLAFDAILAVFEALQRPLYAASSRIAIVELRTPSSRMRSLAIAATGAIAVFGSVAIEGARSNLQRGLNAAARGIDSNAAVWVSPQGEANAFSTIPFRGTAARTLARIPGVSAVGVYRGGFLDWGERRVWVLAPPRTAAHPIPVGQLVQGEFAAASSAIRGSGWAVLSQALADEHHLRIGERFSLPSPRPTTFRVAALSTNLGWPPGAIVLSAVDYARAWGSTDPSAYQVQIDPGASASAVRAGIQRALGPQTGLLAETVSQRVRWHYATTRQALSRLAQIGTLVLIAAVLAMAGAMGSMIWQRRPQLAYIKRQGYKRGVLWRALLCESALLLGAGCSLGALFGVYGQLLLSHALASVTGFPIVFSIGGLQAISSFALVSAAAVAILALPGYLAVRVPPTTVSTA
jgi:putative ABC transport system permease protein